MKYRSDIDGLRALAIIPVVLFHAGVRAFSGGYVGVDIFFVISGYVIALSLLDDLHNDDFSILKFYAKRIRRIFPALFVIISVVCIFAWVFLLPSHFNSFAGSVAAGVTFMSNFYFWKSSNYFASDALTQPLLHTWSLSVEEQYYIFIPTLIWLVYRHLRLHWAYVFLPAIAASLTLSIYLTTTGPTANFYLLPTRAWELLIGALLATSPPPPSGSRALREILGAVGVALIIFPIITFNDSTPFPGANALYPCMGSVLLIYLGTGSTSFANRCLESKPLVWIGLISYSLYLVHWPIASFTYYLTASSPNLATSAGIVGASLVLAWLSWRFVEQPFRKLSIKPFQAKLLWGGVAAIALFAAGGELALQGKGSPSRFPDFTERHIPGHDLWHDGTCFLPNNSDPSLWKVKNCTITGPGSHRVLLWGDSFMAQYVPGVVANQNNLDAVFIQYTAAGCPPLLAYYSYARPHCTDFNRNVLQVIKDNHIDSVILSGRWRDLRGRGLDQLADTLSELKKLNVEIFVIGQSPEFAADVQILSYRKLGEEKDGSKAWTLSFNPSLNDDIAKNVQDAHFIDPLKYLCKDGSCPYFKNNEYLFEDYGHLSRFGSAQAVAAFFPFQKKPGTK